jgi:dolichol-phosphate mannosyltransferase
VAKIGVVVPVYQGEPTLAELHRRLVAELSALTDDWEVVFVDDGSRDRSWVMLEEFATRDARVRAIKLVRNFGEHVAITAGLDHADGDHTCIMACDLQDDPAALPAILDAARTTGADLVLTRRMQRQDPLLQRMLARMCYATVRFFV